MPVVQNGQYFNIKLDPGESIVLTKQYEGAGKISANGSYRYSFITQDGNSASIFVNAELSAQLAGIPVGTQLTIKKDEGQFGKISAALANGTPIPQAAPTPTPAPFNPANPAGKPEYESAPVKAQPVINRDQSIAWQNANNAAAVIASQIAGDLGAKMDAFKVAQESIFLNYLAEFAPEVLEKRKLLVEAEKMFDGEKQ